MGLPYNPSSFATNKTILEAIEELKQYLIQNPLTSIFGTTGSWTLLTIPKYAILNPANRDIEVGDILLSDGKYGVITVVNEDDVEIYDWIPFSTTSNITNVVIDDDGSDLEIIDPVSPFTAWIYRYDPRGSTGYRRGRKYNLIFTFNNPQETPSTWTYTIALPIQSIINAIWYYTESDGSKTIYTDITKEDNTFVETSFNIPKGADGANGVSVVGATIDGSNHLILTLSDGNTIDAGALPTPNEYTHTVAITTNSGTFSDSDFAKLGYGDSTIVYTDAYSVSTVYKLKIETASILEFEAIEAASRNNLKLIDVNKTTKAYSMTSIAMITSATVSSGTATSGKVLTANGSGGTSWETVSAGSVEGTAILSTGETSGKVLTANGSGGASWTTVGGGGTYYQHSIYVRSNENNIILSINIVNTTSTAYTSMSQIMALIPSGQQLCVSGTIFINSKYCFVNRIAPFTAGAGYLYYTDASDGSWNSTTMTYSSVVTVSDTVY